MYPLEMEVPLLTPNEIFFRWHSLAFIGYWRGENRLLAFKVTKASKERGDNKKVVASAPWSPARKGLSFRCFNSKSYLLHVPQDIWQFHNAHRNKQLSGGLNWFWLLSWLRLLFPPVISQFEYVRQRQRTIVAVRPLSFHHQKSQILKLLKFISLLGNFNWKIRSYDCPKFEIC